MRLEMDRDKSFYSPGARQERAEIEAVYAARNATPPQNYILPPTVQKKNSAWRVLTIDRTEQVPPLDWEALQKQAQADVEWEFIDNQEASVTCK